MDVGFLHAPAWFAVQVHAGREALGANHLAMRGYEVFLPCYRDRRRWSDRTKEVRRALFAGYVFCCIQPNRTGEIVTVPGVIRIVGDGHRPLAMPPGEVEAIQRIVRAELRAEPSPCLEAGQRVRVEFGPLRGLEGVVLRSKDSHRLVIAIDFLRRAVAVELQADWLTVPRAPLPDARARLVN